MQFIIFLIDYFMKNMYQIPIKYIIIKKNFKILLSFDFFETTSKLTFLNQKKIEPFCRSR
jgi:hypothetical protein